MTNTKRSLVALTVLLLLTACTPQRPGSPVAVRQTGNDLDILYVACTPEEVSTVELLRPQDQANHMLSDTDPVLWAIRFDKPAKVGQVTVGETPAGAQEQVKLASAPAPGDYLAVRITLADDTTKLSGFQPKELGNRVAFGGRYMTAEEFASESKC